jgi:Putative peptidoglycan binding domain/Purple acid Phosphatase, N-terminal domain
MKKLSLFALFFVASVGFGASAHAAGLTSQIGVGSRGSNVSALQTFLATNSGVYPAGLVTGYYGALTSAAVANFQIAYNISPVGNVGPVTLAKLNSILQNGTTVLDVDAPFISTPQVTVSGTSAAITWNTSEMSFGKVHYDINPIVMYESTVSMQEPQTSGTIATDQNENTSHSITLNNLNHGQTYYYSIESSDPVGNLSVTLPSSFFLQ